MNKTQQALTQEAAQRLQQGEKPGVVMKKIECYATNVGEMAKELRATLVDPQTEEFKKVDLQVASATIQAQYNQLRETILECTGETFTIELPQGTAGLVITLLLQTLGIDLNAPIVIDSQTGN